ncbi:MAG: HD-GYP domain-containing protein [Longimicrobiales bacterium]
MKSKSYIFTAILAGGAAAALVTASNLTQAVMSGGELIALATLVALGIVAESVSIQYTLRGAQAYSSIAFIPLFAIIALFSPAAATGAALVIVTPAQLAIRKRPPLFAVFNTAQAVLATWAASNLYWTLLDSSLVFGSRIVAFSVMAVTFFISNVVLVAIQFSLLHDISVAQAFRSLTSAGLSDVFYDLLVSPIGLLVAVLYEDLGIPGILLVVLPLFIVRHSYFSKFQLQQANTALLKVLIKAIETRDTYTSGHSVRVSLLAKAIAADLGIRGPRAVDAETAALLHDIGKVDGVYADVIRKPTSLSTDELVLIRTHASRGADFLNSLSIFREEVINGIRHHHERYDGSGYPAGLSGETIPLIARIIQISDSIDAMLSDRPYRRALSLEQVYQELKRCSSTQFDPRVVAAMQRGRTLERVLPELRAHGLPRTEPAIANLSAS